MPVKPIAAVRKVAPARMKAIMQEVRVAPSRAPVKFSQVSEPKTSERPSAPTTPIVAASVGVAMPV